MKLRSLVEAMDMVRTDYGLNADDVAVLLEVGMTPEGEKATIMKIVESKKFVASSATIHARIKRLCVNGFLIKTEHQNNMRYKTLSLGPKCNEFLDKLETVQ